MTPAEFYQRVQQMGDADSFTVRRGDLEHIARLAKHSDAALDLCLKVAQLAAGAAAVWTICAALVVFA